MHKADSAYSKYGLRALFISKFLIGFDTVAVPLAGRPACAGAEVTGLRCR